MERKGLWDRLVRRTAEALHSGALQPIPTEHEYVEDQGVRFLVRRLTDRTRELYARKRAEQPVLSAGEAFNPFLPYEREMYVGDILDTHVALLNKFNVIEEHLLIVTRDYEDQESLLNPRDFAATWTALTEYGSLAFYNGGTIAGASQRHKHLQLVPLPLAAEGPAIPMEPLLEEALFEGSLGVSPALPFRHVLAGVEPDWLEDPVGSSRSSCACYRSMLQAVDLLGRDGNDDPDRLAPYNLLVTRRWMLLVPRSVESFCSISVNSLGFAGALLVWNAEQLAALKKDGPMRLLTEVAYADDLL